MKRSEAEYDAKKKNPNIYLTTSRSTLDVHKLRPRSGSFWVNLHRPGGDRRVRAAYLTPPPTLSSLSSAHSAETHGSDRPVNATLLPPHPAPSLHTHPITRRSPGPSKATDKEELNPPNRLLNGVLLCLVQASGVIKRPFAGKRSFYI